MNTVKWEGYLVAGIRNNPERPHMWNTSAKAFKNKQVAVKVSVEVPASIFIRPQLEARISVPADAVVPLVVDLEVRDNIEQILKQSTGFDVKLVPQSHE